MKKLYLIVFAASLILLCIFSGSVFYHTHLIRKLGINLCASFLDNVEYDTDPALCKIPCRVNNTYEIVEKSDNEECRIIKPSIKIENNTIYALVDTEVVQYVRNGIKHDEKSVFLNKGQSVKLESETVRTKSSYSNNRNDWFIKFIPKQINEIIKQNKLSVNLLLIDSASRFVAKKQLNETVKTLKSLSSDYYYFDMLRYHTIAKNSDPHYPTLFYGVNQEEGKDNHKVIFEDFKEEGYITINNALFVDFEEKLTANNNYNGSDHYINYLCEDPIYNNVDVVGQYGSHARCVGHQQIHKYSFDYLKESIKYYHDRNQPTFSLSVFLDAHDYTLSSLPRIDKDLSDYIQFLHNEKILKDSVLILFSDHGIHYGYYHQTKFGTYDHSLPIMFIVFPQSFIDQNPDIYNNLYNNQNRFVTGFDFHATLFDIAHFGSNRRNDQNKRGISLFKPIPKSRNCRQFNVTFGCTCNMTKEYLNIPQFN